MRLNPNYNNFYATDEDFAVLIVPSSIPSSGKVMSLSSSGETVHDDYPTKHVSFPAYVNSSCSPNTGSAVNGGFPAQRLYSQTGESPVYGWWPFANRISTHLDASVQMSGSAIFYIPGSGSSAPGYVTGIMSSFYYVTVPAGYFTGGPKVAYFRGWALSQF